MATNISGSGDSTFGGTIQSTGIDDNATSTKLTTTSTGIDVTGTVIADGLTVDTNTLYVDSPNNRVGIGTSSPSSNLDVVYQGNTSISGPTTGTWTARVVNQHDSPGYNGLSVQNRWASTNSYIFEAAQGWNGATNGYFPVFTIDGHGQAIFKPQGSEAMRIDSSGNLKFDSGYGSAATAYGCRAWVNFNGTGTVAIRASGNVSSITDNGTGDYTVNFTTAMPDANYSVEGSASGNADATRGFTGFMAIYQGSTPSTSSCRVAFGLGSNTVGNGQFYDSAHSCIAFHR